jgi:hypothetical protein
MSCATVATQSSNLTQKGCDLDYGPYGPDSLWNYQASAKARWLNGALTVYQITKNAGAATVRGTELELQGEAASNLILSAGVGYTKAVLASDVPSLAGVAGQQLENVPSCNGNASAKYSFTTVADHSGYVRADEQYVGESYPDFDRTDPLTFQRAYAILDARTAITHNRGEGELFVDNVCDRRADLSKFISDNYGASNRTRMFTNRPRTIRIPLQRSF